MRCEQCKIDGLRSKMRTAGSTTTLMGGTQFYDEENQYHVHDPNITTTRWKCDWGHITLEKSTPKCPICGA